MADKYLSIDETLGELQIEKEELESMVSDGKLRAFRDGDAVRFKEEDIRAFKKDREAEPTIILPSDLAEEELGTALVPTTEPERTREMRPAETSKTQIPASFEETNLPTVDLGPEEPGGVTEHIVFEEEQVPEVPPVYGEEIIIDEKDLLPDEDTAETLVTDTVTEDLTEGVSDTEKIEDQITVFEETEEVGAVSDPLDVGRIGVGVAPPVGALPKKAGARPGAPAGARVEPKAPPPPVRERLLAIQQQRAGNPVFTMFLVACVPFALLTATFFVSEIFTTHPWKVHQQIQRYVQEWLDGNRDKTKPLWARNRVWPEELLEPKNVENWQEVWSAIRTAPLPLAEKMEVQPQEWQVDLLLTETQAKSLLDRPDHESPTSVPAPAPSAGAAPAPAGGAPAPAPGPPAPPAPAPGPPGK